MILTFGRPCYSIVAAFTRPAASVIGPYQRCVSDGPTASQARPTRRRCPLTLLYASDPLGQGPGAEDAELVQLQHQAERHRRLVLGDDHRLALRGETRACHNSS